MNAKFTVRQALEAVGGEYVGPAEALDSGIFSLVTDSRQVTEGSMFAAIRGERTDGHKYVDSSREKGAVCCICEERVESDCPQIIVQSTIAALQRLAAWYRQSLDVKIVGITGSVGKTTCKEVVASVLGIRYRVHKTQGNFNNGLGLPLTLLSMTDETQVAIIEMGMSAFGEMELLSSIAKPDMCVITNIGHSHMEILGSQEGIFRAKSEIFEHMAPDAPAFLNGDDKFLKTVKRENRRFFGFDMENDIFVQELCDKGLMGSEGVINVFGEEYNYTTAIPGRHVLYPVMAAIGVGLEMGLSREEILKGIKAADTIGGRVNLIWRNDLCIIDDCYNAAPASMEAGLDLLSSAQGETLAVLGDMGELGNRAPEFHAQVGAYAAKKGIGLLAAVGQLSEHMYLACKNAGGRAVYFKSKGELIDALPRILPDNGAVLIKASHFMGFDEIVDECKKKS